MIRTLAKIGNALAALFLAFLLYLVAVVTPYAYQAEERCQRAGWDEARVTWALDVRCVNAPDAPNENLDTPEVNR